MKLAVVDVETTGLFAGVDRVVEIAVVLLSLDGKRLGEICSLINPERDVGPTSIHGLAAQDVYSAPRFADLAGHVLGALDGAVALVGHNVWFDSSFLKAEFQRLGHPWPDVPTLCTMHLAGGGRLAQCCEEFHVPPPTHAHSALDDANATADLLIRLLQDAPEEIARLEKLGPVRWPSIPASRAKPVNREHARSSSAQSNGYLEKLLSLVGAPVAPEDVAGMQYLDVLGRVIEDRRIDENEGDLLHGLATNLGLSGQQIQALHHSFFEQLVLEAMRDSVLTDLERRDLGRVSQLLGLTDAEVKETINRARSASTIQPECGSARSPADSWIGKRVCFTGESQCVYQSQPLTREKAFALATKHGLIVVDSVTKKLDVLVVADPYSQSGKATKARKYGIRVLHEPVFWNALGAGVR